MNLNNVFKRSKMPGTAADFLEWLGNEDQQAVENMYYSELMELPVANRLQLTFLLYNRSWDINNGKWRVSIKFGKAGMFLRSGGSLTAVSWRKSNACLKALLVVWELETRRKVQAVKQVLFEATGQNPVPIFYGRYWLKQGRVPTGETERSNVDDFESYLTNLGF